MMLTFFAVQFHTVRQEMPLTLLNHFRFLGRSENKAKFPCIKSQMFTTLCGRTRVGGHQGYIPPLKRFCCTVSPHPPPFQKFFFPRPPPPPPFKLLGVANLIFDPFFAVRNAITELVSKSEVQSKNCSCTRLHVVNHLRCLATSSSSPNITSLTRVPGGNNSGVHHHTSVRQSS